MTEPVAYKIEDVSEPLGWRYSTLKPVNKNYVPLYTLEQLHPRVKMTQKQYDRLMYDKLRTNLSMCLEYFLDHDGNNKFGLSSENLKGNLTQEDIARAWLNPEETIEIVPNMKWFVRSKKKIDGSYQVLYDNSKNVNISHGVFYGNVEDDIETAKYGIQFATKEEADYWVEPFSEAVQLPVDEEK